MMSMIRLSLAPLVLFWMTLCTSFNQVKAGVDLCGRPGVIPPMDRFDCLIHINPNLSCGQLFFQMAGMNPNAYTNQMMGLFSNMCCNANVAMRCYGHPGGNQGGSSNNNSGGNSQPANPPAPGKPSGYNGRGPNGTCYICGNGGDLQDTYNGSGQKIHYNLRYIGRPNAGFSCEQFSWLGKNGYIPDFMCGPVMSMLPRYCPVCSGGGGAQRQQQQPQQQQAQTTCSDFDGQKDNCKNKGCKYDKKWGVCRN